MSEHGITGLCHGSLHQSNLKSYKLIGFLNTSQHEVTLQSVCKSVVYLAFTPLATMV